MDAPVEPVLPFRWDVAAGDVLGGMPLAPCRAGHAHPLPRWLTAELTACAAKVFARAGGGAMYFVGRSGDSIRDMLAAVLRDTSHAGAARLLPFSAPGDVNSLTQREVRQWRENTRAAGLTPRALARAERPVALCDLVAWGHTFGCLYGLLREWCDDEAEPWSVIRRKLRFVGVVNRLPTSPKTWRWQQNAEWVRELPASAVANVSLDVAAMSYLCGSQRKLTDSFTRWRWDRAELAAPMRDEDTRRALDEELRFAAYARSPEGRAALIAQLVREPAFKEPWLRAVVGELRRGRAHDASRA